MTTEQDQMNIEEETTVIASGSALLGSSQGKNKKSKEELKKERKERRKARKAKNPNSNIQISSEQGQAMKRAKESIDLVLSNYLNLKTKKRKLEEELEEVSGDLEDLYKKFPVLLDQFKMIKDGYVKPIGGIKDSKRKRLMELGEIAKNKKSKNQNIPENIIKEQEKLDKEIKAEQKEYKLIQEYKAVSKLFGDD